MSTDEVTHVSPLFIERWNALLNVKNCINVITLKNHKRLIEADVLATQYNFTSPTERSEFRDYIKAKYKYMVGTQLHSLSVQYEQSEFEFNRQITHLYLAVQFRPMSKTSLVEIDVNRTTYDDANGQ